MNKKKNNKEKTIFQFMTNLSFIERKIKNQFNQLFKSHQITSSQGLLLIYLYMLDSPIQTTQIAKYLSLNKSSVTHLKQMLLDLNLVEETIGAEDKRKSFLQINDKGRKKAISLLKDYKKSSFYQTLNNLNTDELFDLHNNLLNITKSSFDKTEHFISFLNKLDNHFPS